MSSLDFCSAVSFATLLCRKRPGNNVSTHVTTQRPVQDGIGMLTGLSVGAFAFRESAHSKPTNRSQKCGPFFDPLASEFGIAFGVNSTIVSAEMSSRGTPWSLLSGFFVAMPSGVGVALGISGGGINALVGVAISAALLPPIVNSGLCHMLAIWHVSTLSTAFICSNH